MSMTSCNLKKIRDTIKFFDHQAYAKAVARKHSVKRCSQKFLKTDRKKPASKFLKNKSLKKKVKNVIKKRVRPRWFLDNFAKFLKTPFWLNTSGGCFVQFESLWILWRQLCKWISKLVTTYVLLVYLCLFLASTSFPFTSRRACSWENMTVLIFHVTTKYKCHVTFWAGSSHPDSAPYKVLGNIGIVNVEIKRFNWHVSTWSMCHVTLQVRSSHPKSPPCYVWGP